LPGSSIVPEDDKVLFVEAAHPSSSPKLYILRLCVKMRLGVQLPEIGRSSPDEGIPRRIKNASTWLLPTNHAPSVPGTYLKSSRLSANPVPCYGHH